MVMLSLGTYDVLNADASTIGTVQSFQPKLVLTIDAVNGIPLDLNLSEETRRSLENLVRQKLRDMQIREVEDEVGSVGSSESQLSSLWSETDEGSVSVDSEILGTEICKKRRFAAKNKSPKAVTYTSNM